MFSAAASKASRSSASRCPLAAGRCAARPSSRVTGWRAAASTHFRRREAIAAAGEAIVRIDLRPDITGAELERRLGAPRGKQSLATFLRKTVALAPAAVGLLHEATAASSERPSIMAPAALAQRIKAVPVRLSGVAPLASAISTAGGVAFEEIDERFMVRRRPGLFVAGEMLDWDAPTGGYLLQAAFATGAAAGHSALEWLGRSRTD
jgi:predicted flavoprotein YhiN